MTTAITLCIIVAGLIACLIAFRNTYFVKKYWRYSLILIPAALILVVILLSRKRDPDSPSSENSFNSTINNIKDQLNEANMVTTIEVTAAKQKNQDKLDELKKVTAIEDGAERRRRLAEMMG